MKLNYIYLTQAICININLNQIIFYIIKYINVKVVYFETTQWLDWHFDTEVKNNKMLFSSRIAPLIFNDVTLSWPIILLEVELIQLHSVSLIVEYVIFAVSLIATIKSQQRLRFSVARFHLPVDSPFVSAQTAILWV